MKKLLIPAAILVLSATTAQAEVSVGIGINQPAYPVYYEPAPVAYYPYYRNDRHHNYDWSYWHPQPVRVVEVHRDYDDRDEHHDNGNRGNNEHRGNSGHKKDKHHR